MRTIMIIISGFILLISCGESPPQGELDFSLDEEIVSDHIPEVTDTALLEDTLLMASENEEVISTEGPEGTWTTTMGVMELSIDDRGHVNGAYPLGSINGELDGTVLEFTYSEGTLEGSGSFVFNEEFSSFQGIQDIAGTELIWNGQRM
ncbi:MAG: hypothetical protein K8R76_02070 [Candidatus Aegiribacteria sp.]|nr:hypothetical protein [Candidatus Aegiribacteria sp.]